LLIGLWLGSGIGVWLHDMRKDEQDG